MSWDRVVWRIVIPKELAVRVNREGMNRDVLNNLVENALIEWLLKGAANAS